MKEFLHKLGISREDFALMLGIEVKTVHCWCMGERLSERDKNRICRTFKVSRKELNEYV